MLIEPRLKACFESSKYSLEGCSIIFGQQQFPDLTASEKNTPDSHLQIMDEKERILKTVKAIEGYVLFVSIAMGCIQMLCLKYEEILRGSDYRYLRTPSRQVMSEASIMKNLHQNLFRFMAEQDDLTITKIISGKQIPVNYKEIDLLIS